jgi:hypothetical protein
MLWPEPPVAHSGESNSVLSTHAIARRLPGWTGTRAILHLLRDPARLPHVTGNVAFLDPDTIDQLPISKQLRRELHIGAEGSPIAAAFVNGQPVSFCYAGSVTESL